MTAALALRASALGWFKRIVYALLVLNIFLFLRHATLAEAIDSLGWVLLLAAFEWESRGLGDAYAGWREKAVLAGLQLAGYGLALYAWAAYFHGQEWPDFANSSLWLLVCAGLAYDLYFPGRYGSREWRWRNALKILLYGGIIGLALFWGVTGEWLDFYDALLWVLCFFVVELKLLAFEAPD